MCLCLAAALISMKLQVVSKNSAKDLNGGGYRHFNTDSKTSQCAYTSVVNMST